MTVDSGDVAIILAMVTFAAFLWQVIRERNKPHVDMSEAAQNLIGPYRDEVRDLRKRVEALEHERARSRSLIDKMLLIIEHLCEQIENAGMNPDIDQEELRAMIELVREED